MFNFYVRLLGIVSEISANKLKFRLEAYNCDLASFEKRDNELPYSILIFLDYSFFDIQIGANFLYLIEKSTTVDVTRINGQLKFVTQNFGAPYDSIPLGHKTACVVCFDRASYQILISKVPVIDSWDLHDKIFWLSSNELPDFASLS